MGILKLNLLPAYLGERRKTLGMIKYMLILLPAVSVVLVLYVVSWKAKVAAAEAEYTEVKRQADAVRAVETQAQGVNGQIPAYEQWVNWYRAVEQQGDQAVATLRAVSEWIYRDVELKQMSIRGATVNFEGRARNLEAMKKFFLEFRLAEPFTAEPQISYQITAWSVNNPPDDSKPITFRVQGTLKAQYALSVPGIPAKTIGLGAGTASQTAGGGGPGGGLGPATMSAGGGGGGGPSAMGME